MPLLLGAFGPAAPTLRCCCCCCCGLPLLLSCCCCSTTAACCSTCRQGTIVTAQASGQYNSAYLQPSRPVHVLFITDWPDLSGHGRIMGCQGLHCEHAHKTQPFFTSAGAEALAQVRTDPLHSLLLLDNRATSCLEVRMPCKHPGDLRVPSMF